jgi:transcriptional regulator GlxA family with amidase domain
LKIQILLYPGFDELDVVGPYEVLKRAQSFGAELEVQLATLERGKKEIVGQHGLSIKTAGEKFDEKNADLILVPGGGWVARSAQGAYAESKEGKIPKALKAFHLGSSSQNSKTIATVCTGAMLLSSDGLLKGRNATTHHSAWNDFRSSGGNLIDARVVDDGDLISSGGVTSGIDLALWLVEKYFGSSIAVKIEDALEYERRGTVWKKERS